MPSLLFFLATRSRKMTKVFLFFELVVFKVRLAFNDAWPKRGLRGTQEGITRKQHLTSHKMTRDGPKNDFCKKSGTSHR
jgi:hypothetical protein